MKQQFLWNLFFLVLIGFSLNYTLLYFLHFEALNELLAFNKSSIEMREKLFFSVVAGSFGFLLLGMLSYGVLYKKNPKKILADCLFQRLLYSLRPIGLFFLFPLLWNRTLWPQYPLFYFPLSLFSLLLFVVWVQEATTHLQRLLARKKKTNLSKTSLTTTAFTKKETWFKKLRDRWRLKHSFLVLGMMILGYGGYVSYYTIVQHYSLQTTAFDLGLVENLLWNSIHGRFMITSVLKGGVNLLGFHTSFIYMTLFPLYWLFPKTETLFIFQAFLIGGAALPLFLIALKAFGHQGKALLIVSLYLIHPAIGGANFYDFHELAFGPILFFSAFYCWMSKREISFWVFILLLLSVKETMSLIVFLLGFYFFLSEAPKRGLLLMGLGLFFFFFLQKIVIPFFASGYEHSWFFTFYYKDLAPVEEGVAGLLKTLIINPLYCFRYFCSGPKILYLFQIFAPVAFICFFSLRGAALLSYGILASVASTRAPLSELGFQYAFQLVPYAFVAAVMELASWDKKRVILRAKIKSNTLLGLMFLLSLLVSFHYGMFYPRHNFKGGFKKVNFHYSDQERLDYAEVLSFVAQIPAEASVVASETLVPHVIQREKVETLRYATIGSDYYFVFVGEVANRKVLKWRYGKELEEVWNQKKYRLIRIGSRFLLYQRKDLK